MDRLEDIGKLISMEQVSGLCEWLFKIGTACVYMCFYHLVHLSNLVRIMISEPGVPLSNLILPEVSSATSEWRIKVEICFPFSVG